MSENKNLTAEAKHLNDKELSEVAGAVDGGHINYTVSNIYISQSEYCGTENNMTHTITYRPCPRCGKPMHTAWYNTKWYCDPCDFSEYHPREETWKLSKEALIAAAR